MPNGHEEIVARLVNYLGEHLERAPKSPIGVDSHLVKDLNLDSIQSFEMVADLEDHYEVAIPLDAMNDLKTVGDLAKVIASLLADQ